MGHILVVDDDPDVCHLMVRLLTRLGHQASCVTSGRAALEQIESDQPNVVLLDVMMPEMSGIDVLRAMRCNDHQRRIPVIMFSALSDASVRNQAMELGANDYWVKASMDVHEIMGRLQKFLPAP